MTILYNLLIKPKSFDEDNHRKEYILNILLVGSVILSCLAFFTVLNSRLHLGLAYRGVPVHLLLIPIGVFGLLLTLSRIRFRLIAANALLFLYYLFATYSLYEWGVLLPQGLLIYALVIVMCGILIGTRAALSITIAICITFLTLIWLQVTGQTHPNLYWINEVSGIDDGIIYVATLGIIFIVSWLGNRELERSLARTRSSEAALKRERDLLEVRIEERTQQLRQAEFEKIAELYRFAEIGQLTAGILHDLATPLTTITMNLEQLETNEHSRLVARAIKANEYIKRFIMSMRKQMQQQDVRVHFSPAKEIRETIIVMQGKALKNKVALILKKTHSTKLRGNPTKFNQIIANLISNAIDAYESTNSATNREVIITHTTNKHELIITVSDFGQGITQTNTTKIFDPFFTTKSIDKGSGIGLSMSKQMIEKEFNGSISVTSQIGTGTEFALHFPIPHHDPAIRI